MLLGDPAARLSVKSNNPAVTATAKAAPVSELRSSPAPRASVPPPARADTGDDAGAAFTSSAPEPAPHTASTPRSLANPQVALRERAVLALIRGDEAPRSIAARCGLSLDELFYWFDVYRESGRRALDG